MLHASWDCLLRVLPPSRATNSYVAESKSDIYFLQHENLLREKVVIRSTNNPNLQRQHSCTTSCTKMLPVLLGLYRPFRPRFTCDFQISHVICQIHLPYTGYCCPERLLCMSSIEKKSEIYIREQFVTRMVRCGGEIENGDFGKGKNVNVRLFWYVFVVTI